MKLVCHKSMLTLRRWKMTFLLATIVGGGSSLAPRDCAAQCDGKGSYAGKQANIGKYTGISATIDTYNPALCGAAGADSSAWINVDDGKQKQWVQTGYGKSNGQAAPLWYYELRLDGKGTDGKNCQEMVYAGLGAPKVGQSYGYQVEYDKTNKTWTVTYGGATHTGHPGCGPCDFAVTNWMTETHNTNDHTVGDKKNKVWYTTCKYKIGANWNACPGNPAWAKLVTGNNCAVDDFPPIAGDAFAVYDTR